MANDENPQNNTPDEAASLHNQSETLYAKLRDLSAPPKQLLLIISDNEPDIEAISNEASLRNLRYLVAHNPQEARELFKQNPDIALLCLGPNSPENDSFALLKQMAGGNFLKHTLKHNKKRYSKHMAIPVIVYGSADSIADRVEAARLGASSFLQKPKSASQIIDTIVNQLDDMRAATGKILVVDKPENVEIINTLLLQEGYQVSAISDAYLFWKTLEEFNPDLIVVNIELPNLSGLELCQVVRSDPRWHLIPVIIVANNTEDRQTLNLVFQAGGDDFVEIGALESQLIIRIKNRLDRTRVFTRLAETDPLTGLKNRRTSSLSINQLMRLSRSLRQPFSIALIDLDHFKSVNDVYGHAVGDVVLRRLGVLLLNSFRGKDIAARWGGEELVIGMFGLNRENGVHRIAEVLDVFRRINFTGRGRGAFNVTFSAGVAEYPSDGIDLHALYRSADDALYKAKTSGRCRVLPAKWRAPQGRPTSNDLLLFTHDESLRLSITNTLCARGYSIRHITNIKAAIDIIEHGHELRAVAIDTEAATANEMAAFEQMLKTHIYDPKRCIMLIPNTRTLLFPLPDVIGLKLLGKPFADHELMRCLRKTWQ